MVTFNNISLLRNIRCMWNYVGDKSTFTLTQSLRSAKKFAKTHNIHYKKYLHW